MQTPNFHEEALEIAEGNGFVYDRAIEALKRMYKLGQLNSVINSSPLGEWWEDDAE